MRVLFGCEESGKGRESFAKLGHDAYSCDLNFPRYKTTKHFRMDIMQLLDYDYEWDLIILHPPCDFLAVCGNRWYANTPEREHAIAWTVNLYNKAKKKCHHVALENPVSVIFKYLNADIQYIQPWQFGHGETKKTGLALHGLPKLNPTNIVEGREQRIWKMPPGPNRKRDRSESYQGIMDAMADQWGNINA